MKECPCCSGKEYALCCEPFHLGKEVPKTAEELMRSRYAAYVVADVDFIVNTMLPEKDIEEHKKSVKKWAESSNWEKLEILNTEEGLVDNDKGYVEFKAYYTIEDRQEIHHELAYFERRDDNNQWIFVDGKEPRVEQVINEEPKIGRNDPCPCGSGKKYKKCCG